MSYTIQNNRGQTVTVIPDRQVDTTATSLALVGFDVTNYGLDHNENFISLLENFANSSAPVNPMEGQLWYDTNNDEMMLYSLGAWNPLNNSTPSVSGNPELNGLGGIYHLAITSPATSVLLYFAGGEVVMIMSPINLSQSSLPASATINSISYPIASRFPYGIVAGTTMAEDSADFRYMGDVPLSEQSHFAGGASSSNLPAGWTYVDLGANTVGLMVSNGAIICAISQATIANSALPTSVAVNVRLSDHTIQTTNLPCQSVFPGGLSPGMTFSSGFSVGGFVTLSLMSGSLASQYALITQQYQTYADSTGSTAQAVQTLEAKFTTAAGNSSFSSAIDYVLTQATNSQAVSSAIQTLHTDFQTALGTSDWSDALTKLSTISTETSSNSDLLTQLQSAFQTTTGQTTIAAAVSHLWTQATSTATVSGWSLQLDSNGYAVGIDALNGGATSNFIKFSTDNFMIASPSAPSIYPFQVVNGNVVMHNVEVDTLKINSAVVPVRSASTTTFYGGSGSFPSTITQSNYLYYLTQILLTAVVIMPVPGFIEIISTVHQSFTNGTSGMPWNMAFIVTDTTNANTFLPESSVGGSVPGDSVAISGSYYAAVAGNYTITLRWQANPGVLIKDCSMFVKGFPYTQ